MSMEINTIDGVNLSGSILVLSRYKRRVEQNSLDPNEELDDNFDVLAEWKTNEFKYRDL